MNTYMGIDPGLDGAIAIYTPDGGLKNSLQVFDIPTHEITVNRKKKRRIDLYGLVFYFGGMNIQPEKVVIEDPNSYPEQGVTSAFNFGFNCGVAQMVVAASGFPMTLVKPNVWKRQMGLTKDKDASRRLASQLFPQFVHLWSRKKDDGRAEAALLAYYGSKLL